jgi:hypothetical protein
MMEVARHRNLLERSLTLQEFYMCILLDQILDNNLIDIHSTSKTVKFTISIFVNSILFPCTNIPWFCKNLLYLLASCKRNTHIIKTKSEIR